MQIAAEADAEDLSKAIIRIRTDAGLSSSDTADNDNICGAISAPQFFLIKLLILSYFTERDIILL
jgi:hypothetical protein